ncbi:hypothetical protein CIHG_10597, partial [Coccidioides immitis H538.4]
KEFWHRQFYSLSFLCDLGFMTLELHQCFLLYCWSLLYCQFYNIIKKIFMASKHSLFANENLDTLALDSRLVQIWQHIRKAISHFPLVLLHVYIHTKQQCHVTISNCCQQFYGTQKKYWITAAILQAMDQILQKSNLVNHSTVMPQCSVPFLNYYTNQLLR